MDHIASHHATRRDDAGVRALKPVIAELVRTEVHPPVLELLLDKIHIDTNIKVKGGYADAFRIRLSDGEYCIQALLKAELHPFLIFEEIREGSYVHITRYELARGKKSNGDGYVLHLRISYLEPVGYDGRTPTRLGVNNVVKERRPDDNTVTATQQLTGSSDHTDPIFMNTSSNRNDGCKNNNSKSKENDSFADSIAEEDMVDLLQWYAPPGLSTKPSNTGTPSNKRKRDDVQDPLQPLSPNVNSSPTKASPKVPQLARTDTEPLYPCEAKEGEIRPAKKQRLPGPPLRSMTAILPITRPLQILSLASVIGSKASTGRLIDVFAVIYAVTPSLIRCTGSSHYKRELRITDPSTSRKVLLSVFTDPESFEPATGTVALFRSVTTNRWDGGSLNAYKRDCAGKEWFIPDPVTVQGCDVIGLEEWWKRAKAEEAVIKRAVGLSDK